MDMVKVDPKLFITCRLCLEEMGMYQITPVVQQQIKYCFDIDVDQFDGLPQLICGPCETILSEYNTKKRIFVGRQNALKAKLAVRKEIEGALCPSPQHEAVSSSQQNDSDHINTSKKSKPKKRKSRVISSSSSSSSRAASPVISRDTSASPALSNKESNSSNKRDDSKRVKTRRESWEANYTKNYACKLCSKFIKYGAGLKNHVRTHTSLLSKYKDILERPCEVKLIKVDGKPNHTGNMDTVALREDKIIGEKKENVFVVYCPKENPNATYQASVTKTEDANDDNLEMNEDDVDDIVVKSKQTKRRRLISGSSTDTVILKNDNVATSGTKNSLGRQTEAKEVECINIDDSSNSSHGSESPSLKDSDNISVKPKDVEAIKNLIKVCQNKYISKREEALEAETKKSKKDPQLKHKLLSMGRKVINKQGLSCTGLLRFMERKNLAVKWIPTNITSNKETNYVRVLARLKLKDELEPSNWAGQAWKNKPSDSQDVNILENTDISAPKSNSNDIVSQTSKNHSLFVAPNKNGPQKSKNKNTTNSDSISTRDIEANVNTNPKSVTSFKDNSTKDSTVNNIPNETNTANQVAPNLTNTDHIYSKNSLAPATAPEAPFQNGGDNSYDKKLLNANPVANPKKLPKKPNNMSGLGVPNLNVSNPEFCIDLAEYQPSEDMCMPIITSTTSLAGSSTEIAGNGTIEKDNNADTNPSSTNHINKADNPAPRIKVKPASELMSDRVLKNLGHQQSVPNMWNTNISTSTVANTINMANLTRSTPLVAESMHSQGNPFSNSNTVEDPNAFVIMDTVELPNTKTDSPLSYFKNLLQMHGLILLNSDEPLPVNATCLIKFKLQFIRDAGNQPVTLCLSVHCAGRQFSLGVRDPTQVSNIDLNKLTANWQWEILKIYTVREDVIKRMLQNAQKVNQNLYDNTKSFLCLLKSINLRKANDN